MMDCDKAGRGEDPDIPLDLPAKVAGEKDSQDSSASAPSAKVDPPVDLPSRTTMKRSAKQGPEEGDGSTSSSSPKKLKEQSEERDSSHQEGEVVVINIPGEPVRGEEPPSVIADKCIRQKRNSFCSVSTCPSPADVTYHCFPSKDMALQSAWIRACRMRGAFKAHKARVCESHFSPEAYERDLVNELLNLPLRKRLKKGAVPTLKLLSSSQEEPVKDNRAERAKRKENKELVSSLLNQEVEQIVVVPYVNPTATRKGGDKGSSSLENPGAITLNPSTSGAKNKTLVSSLLNQEMEQIVPYVNLTEKTKGVSKGSSGAMMLNPSTSGAKKVSVTKELGTQFSNIARVEELRSQFRVLEESLKSMRKRNLKLFREVKRLKSPTYVKDLVRTTLLKSHTPTQVQMILNKGMRGYTDDEVTNAMILNSISPKAFDFLRDKKLIPLPSRHTQNRWMKNFAVAGPCRDDDDEVPESANPEGERTTEEGGEGKEEDRAVQSILQELAKDAKEEGAH